MKNFDMSIKIYIHKNDLMVIELYLPDFVIEVY